MWEHSCEASCGAQALCCLCLSCSLLLYSSALECGNQQINKAVLMDFEGFFEYQDCKQNLGALI